VRVFAVLPEHEATKSVCTAYLQYIVPEVTSANFRFILVA
jgi:hypothetical protein